MLVRHFKKIANFLLITTAIFNMSSAYAYDANYRVANFDMAIEVQSDSSVVITEKIRYYSDTTTRNLFRDLQNIRRDANSDLYRIDFKILSVTRDGVQQDHSLREYTSFDRLYIGNSSEVLSAGMHEITVKYVAQHAISHGLIYDSLDWAINLDSSRVPIDKAKVTLKLPSGAEILAYEIKPTDKDINNYSVEYNKNGEIVFNSKRGLLSQESFGIGVRWPQGFVQKLSEEPYITYKDGMMRFWAFLALWLSFLVGICYSGKYMNSRK